MTEPTERRPGIMALTDTAYFLTDRGWIRGAFTSWGLCALSLPTNRAGEPGAECAKPEVSETGRRLLAALEGYFAGVAEEFRGIDLDLSSGTEFQREVWLAARETRWGHTATYADLAKRLGRTAGSARAVGRALAANPIAIIIPCHRFIAANGDLVNYAAGLDWKRDLLRLEGVLLS